MRLHYSPILNLQTFPLYRLFSREIFVVGKESEKSQCRSNFNPSRNFFLNSKPNTAKKEYAGRKLIGFSMEGMFDVVSDVENYKNFLPFCKKSTVSYRSGNNYKAEMVVGFPPLVESYTSNVTVYRPHLIKANCTQFKLFNHLNTTWKFSPGLKNNPETCIIDFYVSFEFRSPLHSQLAHLFFNELVRQMEGAFYEEAKARYGKPAIKSQFLGEPNLDS